MKYFEDKAREINEIQDQIDGLLFKTDRSNLSDKRRREIATSLERRQTKIASMLLAGYRKMNG
jgi:hypothetical protein